MAEDKCPANGYVIKVIMHNFYMLRKLYLMVISNLFLGDLAVRRRTSVPPIQPPTLSQCSVRFKKLPLHDTKSSILSMLIIAL